MEPDTEDIGLEKQPPQAGGSLPSLRRKHQRPRARPLARHCFYAAVRGRGAVWFSNSASLNRSARGPPISTITIREDEEYETETGTTENELPTRRITQAREIREHEYFTKIRWTAYDADAKGLLAEPKSPPPEGHHCFGCSWGQACVRPCYRDIKAKALDAKSPTPHRDDGFERD